MKLSKVHLIKIFAIAIVAFVLLSFFQHSSKNFIFDAAVNEETGMITFLTLDYELKTYDRYGNIIYDLELLNTDLGYAHLDYEDGLLIVHVLRTDEIRIYDAEGMMVKQQFVEEPITFPWDNWNRDSKSYFYETNSHIYCYTFPTFWRHLFFKDEIVVKVIDKETQNEVILWEDSY